MSIIAIPEKVRDKIAAGEVITSPKSVVKELIENSIDAGAEEIKVHIDKGGKLLIRVADNGRGMSKDDLELCAKRHTTSKLKVEDDLLRINTLGFRGEALASISAVSDLIVQSNGYKAVFDSQGNPIQISKSDINRGTVVEIRNLLSKLPARLKFMKSDDAEFQSILALITRYSLASQNIHFMLYKDGNLAFNSPKTTLVNKIYHAFGKEIARNVVETKHSAGGVAILGFISKPGYTRKTRDYQVLFVNGRLVKNNLVSKSVEEGYADKLFLERNPVFVLYINIDPKMIDVNVHPSKEEILFRNEHSVKECIINAIRDSIITKDNFVSVDADAKLAKSAHAYPIEKGVQLDFSDITVKPVCKKINAGHETSKFNNILLLGQVNKTYLVGYDNSGIVLIDQHAAQERILYEKFMDQLSKNAVSKNELIKPFIIAVSAEQDELISKHANLLERYGFDIERFGKFEYAVVSVPAVFGKASNPKVIIDIIDEIKTYGKHDIDRMDSVVATKACRAAVKGGDILSHAEMKSIIENLKLCRNPYTCPHGRPTVVRMSWGDLERKFKRIG